MSVKNGNWRSIFPNTISMGNLLCGVLCILLLLAYNQEAPNLIYSLTLAPSLIIIAVFLDSLDGTFARLLKTESILGEHLDSFADLTTFGIAPTCLLYSLLLQSSVFYFESEFITHLLYLSVICLFPTAVAYRLSRFHQAKNSHYFSGLPSTAGGGCIAVLYLLNIEYNFHEQIFIPIILLISFLMVSNIQYPSYRFIIKSYIFNIFRVCIFAGFIIFITFSMGVYWLLAIFGVLYILSGFFMLMFSLIQTLRIHIKGY